MLENINITIIVCFYVTLLFIVAAGTIIYCNGYYDNDYSLSKFKVKHPLVVIWLKRIIKIFFISLFLLIFVPSKQTVVAMIVAKNVTKQNVEVTKETIKSSIDYIFEKIKSLKDDTSTGK